MTQKREADSHVWLAQVHIFGVGFPSIVTKGVLVVGEKIVEEKPLTLVEVSELLSERKNEKELTYEQDLTLKYAKKFVKLTLKQFEKIKEELSKIEKLDEYAIVKIIDVLPKTKEILQLVLPKNIELDNETAERVLDVTKKYAK